MEQLPDHLRKYIVEQDQTKYTSVDHACWRYILRSLKSFHTKHAHPAYVQGLEDTGIEVEHIPTISHISKKLEKFGWRALPVSGFIPPAAFMELQALGVLPIASDMRSIEHLTYTPAPDIVHEAAGHAPLLANQEYADYLREYATVAKKAILSHEDLELYEAIRVLSDLKESPFSTPEEIKVAEEHLAKVSGSITYISEAAQLGRMNWWTAEYGLIGDINNPQIFGAGLLSSVGESKLCLSDRVKKIPLTADCVKVSYDITEPQPQLFVTPNFQHLKEVLEDFSETMAYKIGGVPGLRKIKKAQTVNTVEFNSGIQISGVLKDFVLDDTAQPTYLKFVGPTQLSYKDQELSGHGKSYHKDGFGSPVARLLDEPGSCLSDFTPAHWQKLGIKWNGNTLPQPVKVNWRFVGGVELSGDLESRVVAGNKTIILTFKNCTVQMNGELLFDPSWGTYDMAVGCEIPSIYGGPADRVAYGEISDFVAARVPSPTYTPEQKKLHALYQMVRNYREAKIYSEDNLEYVLTSVERDFKEDWLLTLEIFELAYKKRLERVQAMALEALRTHQKKNPPVSDLIEEGLLLAQT